MLCEHNATAQTALRWEYKSRVGWDGVRMGMGVRFGVGWGLGWGWGGGWVWDCSLGLGLWGEGAGAL